MNENLQETVQRGIALLDRKIPDWLDKVGDLDTLDMNSCTDCLLCRVTGISEYVDARRAVGLEFNEGGSYGFSGMMSECHSLTPIWREEIKKRLDQRGEKPKYPWTWSGHPARIIEKNLVGRDRLVAIAYLMEGIERVGVARRCELEEAKQTVLEFGQRFKYRGLDLMVAATPGSRAILTDLENGSYYLGRTAPFDNFHTTTFTPEDFGLDPDWAVELL